MRIAIIGRSEILYKTALRLKDSGHEITCIITAKEAPEYKVIRKDFENLAQDLSVPFGTGANVSLFREILVNSKSEIAVSMNYPGIIPQDIIDIFKLGILNAHGGDLPRYRGNACHAWAIINGEEKIGLCIHKMKGGELDSGDIIARDYLEIDSSTKTSDTWAWFERRIPSLTLEAINLLKNNNDYFLEKQSLDPKDSLRCYPRCPEDGRISWYQSSLQILRLINACNKPYSGAYCEFEGEKLIIWDAEINEINEIFCAIPGQITHISKEYIHVACGEGLLIIKEVEFRGENTYPSKIIKSIRKRLK